jgi:hypothetical protein
MPNRMPVLLATLLAGAIASPAVADELAFHSLNGASAREDVKRAFPKALPFELCPRRPTDVPAFLDDYSCENLRVLNFEFGDENFTLTFSFGKTDGNLREVKLERFVGIPRDDLRISLEDETNNPKTADAGAESAKSLDELAALMTKTHGPAAEHIGDRTKDFEQSRWQADRSLKRHAGDAAYPSRTVGRSQWSRPPWATITISYYFPKPVVEDDEYCPSPTTMWMWVRCETLPQRDRRYSEKTPADELRWFSYRPRPSH